MEENNKKYYPVFRIDIGTNPWSMHYVQVAAESLEDIIEHFSEIFPDNEYKGMDIIDEECFEFNFYKVGDKIFCRYFDKDEWDSLTDDTGQFDIKRIKQIEDMYSTVPYKKLDSYSYYES